MHIGGRETGFRLVGFVSATLGVLCIVGAAVLGQSAGVPVEVARHITTAYAVPDGRFLVTLRLETTQDLAGVGIHETLPRGWTIHPLDNAGSAFKRAEGAWVWSETIRAGSSRHVVYEVVIPSARELSPHPLPACFSIQGTLQVMTPRLEIPIVGDSTLEVSLALPVLSAVAHLVPQTKESPDAIDLRLSESVTWKQMTRAIELWQEGKPVPGTAGATVTLAILEKLVAHYETCTAVDQPLPLGDDPGLSAVRTISSFLPCDSVLLREGCRDPGPNARRFTVAVTITAAHDAYGVGLKESVPAGWRVTAVSHDGLAFRAATTEWIYPKRLSAGETLRVIYEVEVVSSSAASDLDSSGCCGQEGNVGGRVSSALGCGAWDVTGETAVRVWDCLPIILVISRWDVERDAFDVTLSDFITFAQVQRAVAFWLEGTPVPHTCGYAIGYETLKAIVAHWLTHTPPTGTLPDAPPGPCVGDPGCYVPSDDSCGWICQMQERQMAPDAAEYVGPPPSRAPIVDAGPDRDLTCLIRTVTLTGTAAQGTPPYRYEWFAPRGERIAESFSIDVRDPGTYMLVVTSEGGCQGADTVVVREDTAPPTVNALANQSLSCAHREVILTAEITGGRPLYVVEWTGPGGEAVGPTTRVVVREPGTYTVRVTGANGCSAADTVNVVLDAAPPTVDAGPDRSLDCRTRQVTLKASASGGKLPFSYEWRTAAGAVVGTQDEITVSSGGAYTATVTGANGCSGADTVNVVLDAAPPTVDAGPDRSLDCRTRKVTLKASVSGGKPPFSYEWRTAAGAVVGTQEEITVSAGGTYTATATGANGCSAADTVNVVLDASLPTVDAGPDRSLDCRTRKVTVQATVSGGTRPFSYEWRNASGAIVGRECTMTIEVADAYTVIVTGANGCSAADTVQVIEDVEAPAAQATAERPMTCANPETTLSAGVTGGRPPYVVEWRDPDGTPIGETMKVSVARPGTYTVSVTGANGCSASATVAVTRDMEPPLVGVMANRALTCADPEVRLTATVTGGRPPYTIEWQNACGTPLGSTESIVVREAGTYFAVVTGANGCSVSGSVAVVEDVEAPTVTATGGRSLTCAVSQATLTADVAGGRPPYVVEWRTDRGMLLARSRSITVSEPGTYVVTAVGANGCSASAAVTVTRDVGAPQIDVTADRVLTCADPEVTLTATVTGGRPPYTIEWQNACGMPLGSTESIVVNQGGTYFAVVVGANGCSVSGSVVVVEDVEAPTVTATGGRSLTCAVSQATLTADVAGGRPPYVVEWWTDRGLLLGYTRSITVSEPGTYVVTAVGANGCRATDSVTVTEDVTPPLVDVGPDRALTCDNALVLLDITVHGGAAPYAYRWTDDCGKEIATTEDIAVTRPGLYTVVVAGANGCSSSASVRVTSKIAAPTVDAGPDRLLTCDTDEVLLDATVRGGSAPYQYAWTDACGVVVGTAEDLVVTQPSVFTLLVRTADGCIGMDSVIVTEASD